MAKCRRCRAEIIWAVTVKGARIPVDAGKGEHGNIRLRKTEHGAAVLAEVVDDGQGDHVSHFVTCPGSGVRR